MKSPKTSFFLWRENGVALGFATLMEDEAGAETEIRSIGVLPASRGKGIGRHLLQHCLRRSAELGVKICCLSVAVTNQKALDLYLRSGFETIAKHACFRADQSSESQP